MSICKIEHPKTKNAYKSLETFIDQNNPPLFDCPNMVFQEPT